MKQLLLFADMEGASGIFDRNGAWMKNGGEEWRSHGRECITSDALAVCNAAADFGIDDILLYDAHFAGNPEYNILLDKLPSIVRVFDIPNRELHWRRIRGQAAQAPFGLITFGQHARYGTPDAYFAHTIQSPPIKRFCVNGLHIAEIGTAVLAFDNTPYLANIGCQASMWEALELSGDIVQIAVKDKLKNWEPSPEETYPIIYQGVLKALESANRAKTVEIKPPYFFSMEVCEGFEFAEDAETYWKGAISTQKAEWTAPCMEIGLELFHHVRSLIKRTTSVS